MAAAYPLNANTEHLFLVSSNYHLRFSRVKNLMRSFIEQTKNHRDPKILHLNNLLTSLISNLTTLSQWNTYYGDRAPGDSSRKVFHLNIGTERYIECVNQAKALAKDLKDEVSASLKNKLEKLSSNTLRDSLTFLKVFIFKGNQVYLSEFYQVKNEPSVDDAESS